MVVDADSADVRVAVSRGKKISLSAGTAKVLRAGTTVTSGEEAIALLGSVTVVGQLTEARLDTSGDMTYGVLVCDGGVRTFVVMGKATEERFVRRVFLANGRSGKVPWAQLASEGPSFLGTHFSLSTAVLGGGQEKRPRSVSVENATDSDSEDGEFKITIKARRLSTMHRKLAEAAARFAP
jgi:hypothetical protein